MRRVATTSAAAWWTGPLTQHASALPIWTAGWLLHWAIAERWLRAMPGRPQERHAVLRRFYLYLVVFVAAAFTLTNLSRVLYGFMVATLGDPTPGGEPLLLGAGRPASWVLPFVPLWWYHWA